MFFPLPRALPLSVPRRVMLELMHCAAGVPTVIAERRMRLAAVVDARRRCPRRPSWCALFLKAFGRVAARRPELRRAYFAYPWPHLYQHLESVASFTVERPWGAEEGVFFAQVRAPEKWSLANLDAYVRYCKEAPVADVAEFSRAATLARFPLPLHRPLWWLAWNLSGRLRAHFFGTFALTSTGADGAGLLQIRTPMAASLHFGLLDDAGRLDVRLSFDHRVMGGCPAARALSELETVMTTEILQELRSLPALRAA